jgi:ABC-type anion transport system duplicated permease subunit
MPRLATIAYVVLGVIVASQHSYYGSLDSLSQVLSAVVATALWPLVLLGASLHLSLAHL